MKTIVSSNNVQGYNDSFCSTRMPPTNCDVKQLNFSIDRILSKDIKFGNYNNPKTYSSPTPSMTYYAGSYKICDFFCDSINRSYVQHSQLHSIPDTYGHIFRYSGNIIRPAPIRPIPKESAPATTNSSTRTETTNCRRRSWSRAVFSSLQRKGLEMRFKIQKYITKPDRRQLAATLGLTDAQVKVWFQNRRMKWRNMKEDEKDSQQTDDASKTDSIMNSNADSTNSYNSDLDKEYCSDEDIDIESNA